MFPVQKFRQAIRFCLIAVLGLWTCLLFHRGLQLYQAARQPIDAALVLGGSIRREIAVAQLASQNHRLPILVSAGSPAPCLWSLFEREASSDSKHDSKSQAWIEPCATSTLGNFRFSLPILEGWKVHHVQLITSGTHQRRATGLARIILGSHGIWVSATPVAETGRPGNQESVTKTLLDWLRGVAWAMVSQVYTPQCAGLVRLDQVVLEDWINRDFECEHQGQVELPPMFQHAPQGRQFLD